MIAPPSNPCEDGTHTCAPADQARCIHHGDGTFSCTCLPGYTGNGHQCSGKYLLVSPGTSADSPRMHSTMSICSLLWPKQMLGARQRWPCVDSGAHSTYPWLGGEPVWSFLVEACQGYYGTAAGEPSTSMYSVRKSPFLQLLQLF